jgi:hypothetical protein
MPTRLAKERRLRERLEFVRFYARWVKGVPNEVRSRQQALLIESFLERAKNFALSPEAYLRFVSRREERLRELEAKLKHLRLPEELRRRGERAPTSRLSLVAEGETPFTAPLRRRSRRFRVSRARLLPPRDGFTFTASVGPAC